LVQSLNQRCIDSAPWVSCRRATPVDATLNPPFPHCPGGGVPHPAGEVLSGDLHEAAPVAVAEGLVLQVPQEGQRLREPPHAVRQRPEGRRHAPPPPYPTDHDENVATTRRGPTMQRRAGPPSISNSGISGSLPKHCKLLVFFRNVAQAFRYGRRQGLTHLCSQIPGGIPRRRKEVAARARYLGSSRLSRCWNASAVRAKPSPPGPRTPSLGVEFQNHCSNPSGR